MDCLPAATRGFESEDHASSRGMVHPRRTRSYGEMRGQTRTEERGGRFSAEWRVWGRLARAGE